MPYKPLVFILNFEEEGVLTKSSLQTLSIETHKILEIFHSCRCVLANLGHLIPTRRMRENFTNLQAAFPPSSLSDF